MKFNEMITLANNNSKTYSCEYGTYDVKNGYVPNLKGKKFAPQELVNALIFDADWSIKVEKKKMTLKDIEKALGYEIEFVTESKKHYDDDFINALKEVGLI